MNSFIKINEKDNVIVALTNIKKDQVLKLNNKKIKVLEDIEPAHKIALEDIPLGKDIIKYSMPIGKAKKDIKKGEHIHTSNVETNLNGKIKYEYRPQFHKNKYQKGNIYIDTYHRFNNDIGIRNELWVIPTVGCVNKTADLIVKEFKKTPIYDPKCTEIDSVSAFSHPYGCSQMGDDLENTKKTLQSIVTHPNAGGVLVLGLGCENNQIKEFKNTLGEYDKKRVKFLVSQEVNDEISVGVNTLVNLYSAMKKDKRKKTSISKLKIGLECGGSDGFSGITANPLLGNFSDFIIKNGATTILTEVPEMFGAETILMNRCTTRAVFDKTVNMINNFKDYYRKNNQVIYDNPSPGNKEGGITTLEDKSLGCIEKGGKSKVVDVLKLNEKATKSGLNLLEAPGNDLIATTALALSGCHIVLFTTGRGTPFGGFVPTLKISTNTSLAKNKPHWIDYNAGKLIDGISMDSLTKEFIEKVLQVVNGQKTKNEINNYREITIFKSGVTL